MRTWTILLLLMAFLGCEARPEVNAPDSHAYFINGTFSRKDLAEIEALVSKASKRVEPILSIIYQAESKNVEVTTGVVRGPLDGGGEFFTLSKMSGVWQIIESGSWVS